MVKPSVPTRFSTPGLSDGAKIILKHFRDRKIPQLEYEFADTLEALFADAEDCERAQAELSNMGLIVLGPASVHIPAKSRVRAAAITLEGERSLARNEL
jgi:hypothetical protein